MSQARPEILELSEEIEALVAELFDSARTDPVVVVTTRNAEAEPLVDANSLAQELHPVRVRIVPTGPLTWELTGLLPEGLGVFGGAARIWWPGFTPIDPQYRHPLIFAYSPDEGRRAAKRIVDEIETRPWNVPASHSAAVTPQNRPVELGATVVGTVRWCAPGGCEVEIAPGFLGWLVRRRRDPDVASGDQIEVRVAGYDDGAAVLERPRSTPDTALSPAAGASALAVRPGPHLFRRNAAMARDSSATSPVASIQATDLAAEVNALQAQLAEAVDDKMAADHRAQSAEHEAGKAIRAISRSERELKTKLRSARDRMTWLEEQLRGTGRYDDPERQLRHEIEVEWERTVQGSDRTTRPLRRYVIGPDFLPSLARLEGITRSKVIEVCVDVLTGRAEAMTSRELHALRVTEAGSTEQRVREDDGAKAWRVSLQVNTPSARRLHFWRLIDGGIERVRLV